MTKRLIVGIIILYQRCLAPLWMLLPPGGAGGCRFSPSCSQYTRQAVEKFGARRGLWLGVRRLLRCHPWHDGGHDPIPHG